MTSKRSCLTGLVGSGIAASLSPALHEREALRLGINYAYRLLDLDRLHLTAADAPQLLREAHRLGFDGLNITHPCKQLVIDELDELSADAAAIRAVNTVVFRDGKAIGYNTDWSGFARGFARALPHVPVGHVVLLGAGGAGAAVAHATLTTGTALLTVVDAHPGRARALVCGLRERFGAQRAAAGTPGDLAALLAGADGLIHATPTGMTARPELPFPAGYLHPRLWVAEVVYRPLETPLLRTARAIGCRTADGGGMAVFQAVDAFRLFTGQEPDAERMLDHLATLVRAPGVTTAAASG